MGSKYVHTPFGIFDIGDIPKGFVSGERTGITLGKTVIIKSCLTKVIITKADGSEEEIAPIVVESCMNPEIKTIMPVTVVSDYKNKSVRHTVTVSNPYKSLVVEIDKDIVGARTEKFMPSVKRADCAQCNNCGRC